MRDRDLGVRALKEHAPQVLAVLDAQCHHARRRVGVRHHHLELLRPQRVLSDLDVRHRVHELGEAAAHGVLELVHVLVPHVRDHVPDVLHRKPLRRLRAVDLIQLVDDPPDLLMTHRQLAGKRGPVRVSSVRWQRG
eukprot:scaffold102811_cov66-Phaeocystis_antarctica.AAC.5